MWYLGGALTDLPGYQISLDCYEKWLNSEHFKCKHLFKIIMYHKCGFNNLDHKYRQTWFI